METGLMRSSLWYDAMEVLFAKTHRNILNETQTNWKLPRSHDLYHTFDSSLCLKWMSIYTGVKALAPFTALQGFEKKEANLRSCSSNCFWNQGYSDANPSHRSLGTYPQPLLKVF